MHPCPDLRPAGHNSERSDAPLRERPNVKAPSTRSRFDEHLNQADERRGHERSERAQAKPDGTARTRDRASEAHASLQAAASAHPEEKNSPTPACTVADRQIAELPDAAPAVAAEGSKLAAAQPEVDGDAAAEGFEACLPPCSEQALGVDALLPQPPSSAAEAPRPQAALAARDLLAATLPTTAPPSPQQPAAVARPAVQAGLAGAAIEGAFAEEAGSSMLPAVLDSPQTAPSPAADEGARTLAMQLDASRGLEAQMARLRETEAPQAPGHVHAQREQAALILRQVRVGLSPDLREANIQLAPESLGRVCIQLRVEEGVLTAEVRAQTPEALRALERHAPELKVALAVNGVEARTLDFQLDSSSARAGDGQGRGPASHAFPARSHAHPVASRPAALERALTRGLSASGIDTFA